MLSLIWFSCNPCTFWVNLCSQKFHLCKLFDISMVWGKVAKTHDCTINGSFKKYSSWGKFMPNFTLILIKIEQCHYFALLWVTFIAIVNSSAWQAMLTPLLPPGSFFLLLTSYQCLMLKTYLFWDILYAILSQISILSRYTRFSRVKLILAQILVV